MHRLVQLAAAVASLASIGQAILVPASALEPLHSGEGVSVGIVCPGCPVATIPYSADTESALRFNISVAHNHHGDALLLNGFQAYPINPLSDIFNKRPLLADQFVKTPTGTWESVDSPDLGWAISILVPVVPEGQAANALNLIKMKLRVLDVGGWVIKGMYALEIKLLETPSGGLMLADVQAVPPPPTHGCTTVICAWRAFIREKLSKLKKGCARMRRPHLGHTKKPADDNAHQDSIHQDTAHQDTAHQDTANQDNTHKAHEHHHSFESHHYHEQTGFMRYLRVAVVRVLIPIMFGIVFGATACIVGIATGHLAVCIWRVLFRRGERYTPVRAESDTANDDDDEGKGFLAPPHYENSPVYQDVVTSEKASE